MKPHDHFTSLKRRAVCATTLAFLVGTLAASAQSSSTSSGSRPNDSTRANQSSSATSGSQRNNTSGSYNSNSTTRSSGSDSNYSGAATTSATGGMAGSTTSADKLSWGDKRFVTKAADHGQSEVALARLASQQASNPEVRRFAQRLVTDHTKVNSELMSLASTKNVKLDKEDAQDRTYRRLSERSGADFDQEFIEQMIDMHEADIKLFEKTSEDAKDQELRSFASRHVGHLREHLQQAQSLRQTIMPTGRDSEASSSTSTSLQGTATPSTGSTQSGMSSSTSDANKNSNSNSSSSDQSRNNR